MSPSIIRRTILAELARSEQYALPQEQLLTQVNLRLRPELTMDELAKQLSWMLDRKPPMVAFLADSMEPDNAEARRWLITEAGLTQLKR